MIKLNNNQLAALVEIRRLRLVGAAAPPATLARSAPKTARGVRRGPAVRDRLGASYGTRHDGSKRDGVRSVAKATAIDPG